MKFKSIELYNFMRYKGQNKIEFSVNDEKNVTIVLGDNTFGKTTLAQAFRWGLYETFHDTSYTKKKDIVLLNNEAIAEMKETSLKEVYVEIIVDHEEHQWKFRRSAKFNKRSGNRDDLNIKQIGNTQLTMQIKSDGKWGNVISNDGDNVEKEYKYGCVQEMIDSMFPPNLSNYFFFDGERWNDLKSKTEDIKESIDTILGVSGLTEMKKHLKEMQRYNVITRLRSKIQGTTGEYERLQREIRDIENSIEELKEQLNENSIAIETTKSTYDSTLKTLNDNRKVEDDQKEYRKLEQSISQNEKFRDSCYGDIVKEFSNSARFFAAALLPKLRQLLETIDLQGKDIPGVTVDTIDYLLNADECLCGTKFSEDSKAYETIMKLRNLVPPEMLGGAAGKLISTLEDWTQNTNEMVNNISEKAKLFDVTQDTIDENIRDRDRLGKTIDRKTNLGPVRTQNQQAKERISSLNKTEIQIKGKIETNEKSKENKIAQLDEVAKHDKANESIYRAMSYAQAMYERADGLANQRKNAIITDLNEIIGENFQRMFNDHEKYAKLENDYKIHVYYHQVGNMTNYEEENLSNGETIAINFVFIVSILELSKRYKQLEKENAEFGMESAILGLPLVLDGPFSALSNDNTTLVASRLPNFAEQVIIFMLDKDWDASGLEKYTLPEYCYRVYKESSSNSSSIDRN